MSASAESRDMEMIVPITGADMVYNPAIASADVLIFELVGYARFLIRRPLNKLSQVPKKLIKDHFDAAQDARPQ